jgi:DNA processing protein
MDTLHARALLARAPLAATELQALISAADYEPARALAARSLQAAALSPPARSFLDSPDDSSLEADLEWLSVSGARILLASDPDYPPLLRETSSAPAALYVLGTTAALAAPQLAMIGSSSPTADGRRTAREFAAWFARAGLTVTSGLAVGIDAASHAGALAGGGVTVAVCGTALDRIHPPEHAQLARRISVRGALVSELPPRTEPRRRHFAQRSRIISGLSLGTLVVEAARDSGSLITARLAAEQGREVFAIPGSIHSALSRGCHQLLRDGAKLVEQAADVMTELRISVSKETLTSELSGPAATPELDKEYEMLLDALGFEGATVDVVVARTHLPGESVASMLLILELQGRVAALPGGRYGRIPS